MADDPERPEEEGLPGERQPDRAALKRSRDSRKGYITRITNKLRSCILSRDVEGVKLELVALDKAFKSYVTAQDLYQQDLTVLQGGDDT
jgi:hypothetical protein